MSQLRDEDGKRQKRPLSDTGMAAEGLLPVQSLNEGTVRAFAGGTARHRLSEYALHLFQVCDLGAYIFEMSCGKTTRLGAWTLAMVRQGQQGPYFINGESERPGSADEGESLEMNCAVETVAAGASPGSRQ
jgi:hypothetical protein